MRAYDLGLLFAILSPFLSSISTVFKGGAVKILGPLPVIAFDSIISAFILLLIIKARKERFDYKKIKQNLGNLGFLIISRGVLTNLLFTFGLLFTDPIKAIFFTKAEPYFVLFWSWILKKESIQLKHLVLLVVHIIGALILSTNANFFSLGKAQLGDGLIIGAMMLSSLSYIPATKLSNSLGAIQTNTIMLFAISLIFLPLTLIFSNLNGFSNPKGWTFLLAQIITFTVLGHTLWFASLKTVKGWIVSSLRSLGPLLGLPVAYFLLGERLSSIQILGGMIVVSTSFLIAREHFKSYRKING